MVVRVTYPVYVDVKVEVDDKYLPLANFDTWSAPMVWDLRNTLDEMMITGKIPIAEVLRSAADNCLDVGDLQAVTAMNGEKILEQF